MDDAEVTQLLHEWLEDGHRDALDRLLPLILGELRRLAEIHFSREGVGHTLQPTALVHEAYLRLTGSKIRGFRNRHQFFALASRLIREVLVDHARSRQAQKRGGAASRVPLVTALNVTNGNGTIDLTTVVAVHQALERLDEIDDLQSRIVEMRFFGGLTLAEIAQALNVSLATAERAWSVARRWLARELERRA